MNSTLVAIQVFEDGEWVFVRHAGGKVKEYTTQRMARLYCVNFLNHKRVRLVTPRSYV